ncbi:N-glycosylation protein-domain-containing protein [Sparassis latifolia]
MFAPQSLHRQQPSLPALFLLPLSPAPGDPPHAPSPPRRSTSALALTPISAPPPPPPPLPPYPGCQPSPPHPLTRCRVRARPRRHSAMSAPSSSPPPYSLTPPEPSFSPASNRRAASSPHLRQPQYPLPSQRARRALVQSDCDDSADDTAASEDDILYTTSASASTGFTGVLRARILGKGKAREDTLRPITTAPGVRCAGETETDGEDSPRNLPTARITGPSLRPLPHTLSAVMPALVSFSRLLAIVPAVFGTVYLSACMLGLGGESDVWKAEFFVAALWAVLTGWQCLQMTTGLLKRWRVYYSPLATLIRLFALQAICWPATHLTLTLLEYEKRPALCWAVVGTTTCCSRSIQLWVTSNIAPAPLPHPPPPPAPAASHSRPLHPSHAHAQHDSPLSALASALGNVIAGGAQDELEWKRGRRRRWDWAEVGRKCALPAGVLYFVTAWAEMIRREVERGPPC